MKAIIARKVGMTQIYDNDSKSIAVTVLDASSCRAVQIKSIENDGYNAAQLTIGESKSTSDPLASHYKKYDVEPGLGLWEVSLDEDSEITPGKQIIVSSILEPGNLVDITGTSKGKGFAGVMKRHNFSGQKASHGVHKVHRAGGSIGNASYPGHVFKGTKMAGRMGGEKSTLQNVKVVAVDDNNNYFLVNGSVPGAKGSVVVVSKSIKINSEAQVDLAKNYSSKVSEMFTAQPESNTEEVENIKGEEE